MIKSVLPALALLAAAGPAIGGEAAGAAPTPEWSGMIGAGAMVAPEYEGADDHDIRPLPTLRLDWHDRVTLSVRNGGVELLPLHLRGKEYRISAVAAYQLGRDEDASSRLKGMGDVDGTALAGVEGEVTFGPAVVHARVLHGLGGGHSGLVGQAGVKFRASVWGDVRMEAGPVVAWAGDDAMDAYFGVTPEQSARSGLAAYDPGAGVRSVALEGQADIPIHGPSWRLLVMGGIARLTGDAADSPLSASDTQFRIGSAVTYHF